MASDGEKQPDPKSETTDWDAIELDYRAGVLPISAIAKKHGVKASTLRSHADKYMWERKPIDPLNVKQAHGVASLAPSGPKFGMDSNLDPEALIAAAILTQADILTVHRKDVMSLRDSAKQFSNALANLFTAMARVEENPDMLDSVAKQLSMLIGDDTPVDLLEKLSRVMVRLVTIERQAYGLDVMPNPDLGDNTADAARSEVAKLWEQVKDLQAQKSKESVH